MRGNQPRIPVGALLRQTPLRGVVDMHNAEPLGVTLRPLEVVEQAPHEVATHRHTRLYSIGYCREMRLEVLDASCVAHLPGNHLIVEGRAVFHDVQRRQRVVAVQAQQQFAQAAGVNLPAHSGVVGAALGRVHHAVGINDVAGVVVQAEEVERCTNGRQIARLHLRGVRTQVRHHIRRVLALEQRVHVPTDEQAVLEPGTRHIRRHGTRGSARRLIEHDAQRAAHPVATQSTQREAM